MVRPMVHSTKHYVQYSIATQIGGTTTGRVIAEALKLSAVTDLDHVQEGSTIKAIYLELWVRAGDTVGASGQMIVYKRQAEVGPASTTEMAALGAWDNKRNILYTTMGLFNDQDADAIAIFKGWIKIPKGKQRFALGDELIWQIFTPTIDVQICGFATYKEYT